MTEAVGDGPVVFFTSKGRQVTYHLTAIEFKSGEPKPKVPLPSPDNERLESWLKELVRQGRLAAAEVPAAAPVEALIIKAKQAGKLGNRITVDVIKTPAKTNKVNVTITVVDEYRGLKRSTLSTSELAGPRSGGVVKFKELPNNSTEPVEKTLEEPTTAPAGGAQPTPGAWALPGEGQGKIAFVIEPQTDVDARKVTVAVTDVVAAGAEKVFTLTATLRLEATEVTADNIAAKLGDAEIARFVEPEAPGQPPTYKLPAASTTTLSGGAETVSAKNATATILAS